MDDQLSSLASPSALLQTNCVNTTASKERSQAYSRGWQWLWPLSQWSTEMTSLSPLKAFMAKQNLQRWFAGDTESTPPRRLLLLIHVYPSLPIFIYMNPRNGPKSHHLSEPNVRWQSPKKNLITPSSVVSQWPQTGLNSPLYANPSP